MKVKEYATANYTIRFLVVSDPLIAIVKATAAKEMRMYQNARM